MVDATQAASEQPMPIGEGVDVFDHLLKVLPDMLKARQDKGIATYGVSLHTNNGRNARLDLIQELLDALVYATQVYIEWDKLKYNQLNTETKYQNIVEKAERLTEENKLLKKEHDKRHRFWKNGTNAKLREQIADLEQQVGELQFQLKRKEIGDAADTSAHKELWDKYLSYREYADTQMLHQQQEIDSLKTQLLAYQAMAFENGTLHQAPPPRDPLDVGRDLPLDDDELYSLTENELSSAVAKAMGWRVVKVEKMPNRFYLKDSEGTNGSPLLLRLTPQEAWGDVPKYATFEDLALRLLEQSFSSGFARKSDNVELARYEAWIDNIDPSLLHSSGPTLPIAACRAYLKLKMRERDSK